MRPPFLLEGIVPNIVLNFYRKNGFSDVLIRETASDFDAFGARCKGLVFRALKTLTPRPLPQAASAILRIDISRACGRGRWGALVDGVHGVPD